MVYQRVIIGPLRSIKVHYGLSEGYYRYITFRLGPLWSIGGLL